MIPEAHIRGGTKMRALYQRKKGRDLFDLGYALSHAEVDDNAVIHCCEKYMSFVVDHVPTYKEYMLNMEEKMKDEEFLTDMNVLLHPDLFYNPFDSYQIVKERLIDRLHGERWK